MLLFVAGIAAAILFAFALFQLTIWLTRHATVPCVGPVRFPMGSLGEWDDLLALNRAILGANAPIVAQWTFWKPSVAIVHGPSLARVFRASTSRALTPALLQTVGMWHIKKFFGEGSVGVTEGTQWSTTRKAIGRSLKPTYVRKLFGKITACAAEAAAVLRARAQDGAPVDVAPLFHALALDIVCEAVFCERVGALAACGAGQPDPVVEAFRFAEDEMVRRTSSMNPLDWCYWGWLGRAGISAAQKRLDGATALIRARVKRVIARRLERGIAAKDDDLLRHLLGVDGAADPEAVIDNVVTMMWAGHDTSAASLSFATYLLATHAEVQSDLRAELDALAAASDDGELTADAVRSAPLLQAVVFETLRLHPPTLWTNRGPS